jgi:hypothetical protein
MKFSPTPSLHLSLIKIFSSTPSSQTPSVYVPPLMSQTKFHTHTEPEAIRLICLSSVHCFAVVCAFQNATLSHLRWGRSRKLALPLNVSSMEMQHLPLPEPYPISSFSSPPPTTQQHTGLNVTALLWSYLTCCYQGTLPRKRKQEIYVSLNWISPQNSAVSPLWVQTSVYTDLMASAVFVCVHFSHVFSCKVSNSNSMETYGRSAGQEIPILCKTKDVQGDSKLLSGFPWSIIDESKWKMKPLMEHKM